MTSIDSDIKGYFNDPVLVTEGFSNYDLAHEIYALTRILFFILTGMSIADDFYQLCSSSYHTLRRNVPAFAEVFTSDEKRHSTNQCQIKTSIHIAVFSNNPTTLDFVCVRGSGFDGEWQKLSLYRLIRINSVPRTFISKFRWWGPDPFQRSLRSGTAVKGKAAKAVVKIVLYSSKWINWVTAESKRFHDCVNPMAVTI